MTHASESNNKRLTLGDLITWSGGESLMSERSRKEKAGIVINDSRIDCKGNVFVALKTDSNDGHAYIQSTFKAGAVAAIIDKKRLHEVPVAMQKKCICVTDPLKAVTRAAASYRKALGILFIGITGSNGKTTTRTFVSSVLRRGIEVGETWSNWNNHIGVPLSILRFNGSEWAGVIEMGANHIGEIHNLSTIVKPDIAVITNIGYGHVGLFGSIAKTTEAKFEIVDGLNKKSGFMLLNGDDPRLVKVARSRKLPTVFYGYGEHCEMRVVNVRVHASKGVTFEVNGVKYSLQMPGRHFIYSALPAIFLGLRCGISEIDIVDALASQKPFSMRGTFEIKNGIGFIVDCYNANPSSMKSSLTYLSDCSKISKRVAILGDMLELGTYSTKLHKQLGNDIAEARVQKLITVGKYASIVAAAAKDAGVSARSIYTCENSEQASEVARNVIKADDVVLLKGSRGVHLETVFENF